MYKRTAGLIARVFPTRTSMCPCDKDAYFGPPDLLTPHYDEVHVSCQFTWDIDKARVLADQWKDHGRVRIGGVAIHGESDRPFVAGVYLRHGITITSRGCPNRCKFCMVRKGLVEFDTFPEGNRVQDNNILACSDRHWRLVMAMLKKQRDIEFSGGLDKFRISSQVAEDLRGLRIKRLWLACDQASGIRPLRQAVGILHKVGFTRSHIYCYVIIGDDARENIHRLREVWKAGCMPFAQLYQPGVYSKAWRAFQRRWDKPQIIRARMKRICA